MTARTTAAALLFAALAMPAAAQDVMGDAEAGEAEFRKCKSCHAIVDDAGETIVKGGRTGPNLYNVIGRQAGSVEGFRYGDALVAAGEAGLVWTPEEMIAYLEDPQAYLRARLDDGKARSKMSFKLRDEEDRKNITAYLVTVSPDAPEAGEGGTGG